MAGINTSLRLPLEVKCLLDTLSQYTNSRKLHIKTPTGALKQVDATVILSYHLRKMVNNPNAVFDMLSRELDVKDAGGKELTASELRGLSHEIINKSKGLAAKSPTQRILTERSGADGY